MEVHHHAHSSRNKWTHYLWEFIMLFLAVFAGFLAENQREHFVEHKREKEFMVSLVNDLKRDMAWLDTVSKSARARIANLDSAILTMSQNNSNEIHPATYQQLRRSSIQIMFFSNDGTMSQLKNAGGMRLIRQKEIVDSIEEYDRFMRRLDVRRDITNDLVHDLTITLNKTVSGKDIARIIYDTTGGPMSLAPIQLNNQYVNELINDCITLRSRAASDTLAYLNTRKGALRLIGYIRQKYDLE